MTDVCLCEYTDHGHCGVVERRRGATTTRRSSCSRAWRSRTPRPAPTSIAPSRHDGRARRRDPQRARRGRLRGTADPVATPPSTRRPSTARSARRPTPPRSSATAAATRWTRRTRARRCARCRLDVDEGADIVMVKPALPYLDVIRACARRSTCRVAAYNVSGEYAMVKAAAANGWLDEERDRCSRSSPSIRRAGADIILTYHAKDFARRA